MSSAASYYWIGIAVLLACVLGLSAALVWALRRQADAGRGLPAEWLLTARPVFSADERRVFRRLREALPHHVVLSKLPLVRFCQPTEAKEVRYWFDLLGSSHVTFAVCSPNGRVLAAIDLDGERGLTARGLQIKQAVLSACRVRYLRCATDQLPSLAELQLLVPQGSQPRGPQPAPVAAPGAHAATQPQRRSGEDDFAPSGSDWGQFSQPLPLWQEAPVFDDTRPAARKPPRAATRPADPQRWGARSLPALEDETDSVLDEIVGVVVEAPRYAARRPRR